MEIRGIRKIVTVVFLLVASFLVSGCYTQFGYNTPHVSEQLSVNIHAIDFPVWYIHNGYGYFPYTYHSYFSTNYIFFDYPAYTYRYTQNYRYRYLDWGIWDYGLNSTRNNNENYKPRGFTVGRGSSTTRETTRRNPTVGRTGVTIKNTNANRTNTGRVTSTRTTGTPSRAVPTRTRQSTPKTKTRSTQRPTTNRKAPANRRKGNERGNG